MERADTAKEVWDTFLEVYQSKDIVNKIYLSNQLQGLKMSKDQVMRSHIKNFKSLIEKLRVVGEPHQEDEVVI